MSDLSAAEKAERVLRIVREDPLISYDTEGSGLDWKRNWPIGYVICSEQTRESLYVPIRHGGGGNILGGKGLLTATDTNVEIHRFERDLAAAMEERKRKPGYKTVGHHIKFDCHFSANAGVMLGRIVSCTQNRAALLDEQAKSYSLSSCAERHGVVAKKSEPMYAHLFSLFSGKQGKGSMEDFWKTSGSDPIVVDYAEGDGITTLELYLAQQKEIDAQNLGVVDKLEDDLLWTLFRMERRGVDIDLAYLENLTEAIRKRVDEIESRLPVGFNPRSPVDMLAYIRDVAGRSDWPTTEAGNPSFTEKYLKGFEEGKLVVQLRKWSNMENTFITPLRDVHAFEGRVHPTLNQLKADDYGTPARLSCSNPNLQQIPKRDKELAPRFRRAFIAPDGYTFNEADWSQCEPRLFAHYSKEPALVEGYNQTPFKDMHSVVAELMSVERDPTAKRMNMGILTGMYPKTFAMHMETDIGTATDMWNRWFDMFPGIRHFQETATSVIKSRGYVRTLLGRRGRLEAPRWAYKAVSKIIQGGNADIAKKKLIEIDMEFEGLEDLMQMTMSVHDSMVWYASDNEEGRDASKRVCQIMEDVQSEPFNLLVPFVAELGTGRNWAEASFGPGAGG